MDRNRLLEFVASKIVSIKLPYPTQVAIDGIDAAGKTIFADELGVVLQGRGRHVVRSSIDGFHNPCQVRYRRGEDSPEGYYLDSFNLDALKKQLLNPLGPGGSLLYRTCVFDFREDVPIEQDHLIARSDSILLFDGVFSFRPELIGCWDFKIYLDISFDSCLRRVVERDLSRMSDPEAVIQRYQTRYIPGQKNYFRLCSPKIHADLVIKNDDPGDPQILNDRSLKSTNKKTQLF